MTPAIPTKLHDCCKLQISCIALPRDRNQNAGVQVGVGVGLPADMPACHNDTADYFFLALKNYIRTPVHVGLASLSIICKKKRLGEWEK